MGDEADQAEAEWANAMGEAPDLLYDAVVAWDKHVVTFNMVLARLRAAEAERDEARADWVALVDEAASTEAERDALTEKLSLVTEDYIKHRNALERAEAALREWREAESLPDCAACSVLDAALVSECRHGGRQQGETPCPDCTPEVRP